MPEPSPEKPKAISIEEERTSPDSISIQMDKGSLDHFFGVVHAIDTITKDKGLIEVIPDEENGRIEVRSFNPGAELPKEVVADIQTQIDKLNAIF